jgi:hypothetical protein
LELLEGVDAPLLEAKLAVADETSGAVPIVVGLVSDLGVETICVVSVVARLAD